MKKVYLRLFIMFNRTSTTTYVTLLRVRLDFTYFGELAGLSLHTHL